MKKLPLYVALDVDDINKAKYLAQQTASYVEGFKIGPRLLLRTGPSLINQLKPYGRVFLDFKFFDIPSTMYSSVQGAFEQGADVVTIHAQAGELALKSLAKLEKHLNTKRPFRILAVTMLTSFQQNNLPPLAKPYSISAHVESLSNMVIKSGLTGLVCSGHEVKALRQKYPTTYLLTPGLRPHVGEQSPKSKPCSPHNQGLPHKQGLLHKQGLPHKDKALSRDQKRVVTPQSALLAGANALVMGRPIYQAEKPAKVCAYLQKELLPLIP